MDASQAISLALVQGITEFLPVSSSAHLILLPKLMDWSDQGIAFDVAVHLGTLSAVVFHYRAPLADMLNGLRRRPHGDAAAANTAMLLAVASVPVLAAGYTLESAIEQHLRAPSVIAATTVGFGLLLWAAVWRRSKTAAAPAALSLKAALIIGLAQTLALIPGTSRAGITITAGLFLGLSREQSINFSFLLAIPVILIAALYKAAKIGVQTGAGAWPDVWPMLALGFAVSAIFALLTIRLFLTLTEKIGLTPFIVYRLALGALLVALLL